MPTTPAERAAQLLLEAKSTPAGRASLIAASYELTLMRLRWRKRLLMCSPYSYQADRRVAPHFAQTRTLYVCVKCVRPAIVTKCVRGQDRKSVV